MALIDPYGQVTEDEIIAVIKGHDKYIKNLNTRRIALLDSIESMNDFIEEASLRGKPLKEDISTPTNEKQDPIYKILLEASRQLTVQEKKIANHIYELTLEEDKVVDIWSALHRLPVEQFNMLIDMYQKEEPEAVLVERYNVSKSKLWRMRRQGLDEMLKNLTPI
jgi:Protein involved in vacuole import and degradation